MPRPPTRTPSQEQARAWIRDLFPPVIDGLETEISWLERRNPSWRFHSKGLEYFGPVRERLYVALHPLLDQFLRYHRTLNYLVSQHDARLGTLATACAATHAALRADKIIRAGIEEADRAYATRHPGDTWYGAFRPDDKVDLVAQYLVNDIAPDGVPDGYTHREFWREHGAQLRELRDRHTELFAGLAAAIGNSLDVTRDLAREIARKRDDLADRYGLPATIVESAARMR